MTLFGISLMLSVQIENIGFRFGKELSESVTHDMWMRDASFHA